MPLQRKKQNLVSIKFHFWLQKFIFKLELILNLPVKSFFVSINIIYQCCPIDSLRLEMQFLLQALLKWKHLLHALADCLLLSS